MRLQDFYVHVEMIFMQLKIKKTKTQQQGRIE